MTDASVMPGGVDGHKINIITWNVQGLGGQIKRSRVFSHLKYLSADIAFLQETHLRTVDHTRLRKPWVDRCFIPISTVNPEAQPF